MGEFNVNKSDGSLNPTAGMPETYPADQVMLSDGVTSVEDKIGNVRITKIWDNPNPTVNFPEQTITVDVVGFDLIAIIAKNSTESDAMVTNITLNGHTGLIISALNEIYSRAFNTTTKKFTAGYKGNTTDNSILIPYQIYGIKLT